MMPSWVHVKGLIFVLIVFVTTALGSIFILVPFIPLTYLYPTLWRSCADKLVGMWLTLPPALLEFMYGVKYYVTGDRIMFDQPGIIIMNHRTRLDWMYFWSVLYKIDPRLLTTEKISLKKELKNVPGAGWAMECDSFIFLDRNWDTDKHRIIDTVCYYAGMGRNYQVLLFPEGTDKCDRATTRSDDFANKMGLTKYEFVLHPRTTGFIHLAQQMHKAGYLKHVYDVTMGYADRITQTEIQLAQFGPPEHVHCHIRRYDIDDIPLDDEQATDDWLRKIWSEKETRLADFYEETVAHKRHFRTEKGHLFWPVDSTGVQKAGLLFSILFWVTTAVMWTYFFFTMTPTALYIAVALAVLLGLRFKYGGVELYVIDKFKRDFNIAESDEQSKEAVKPRTAVNDRLQYTKIIE